EILLVAASAWLMLVWAVSENDRLRNLSPTHISELIRRHGLRLVGMAAMASIVGLAHAWWVSVALEKIHVEIGWGWLLLLLSWLNAITFATFLFRWVGVQFYWAHIRAGEERVLPAGNLPSQN